MHDTITKADIQKARQLLAKCSDLERKIAINEACGIECEELKQRCEHAKKSLTQITQIFAGKA